MESVGRFADAVVALDDGSTDDTKGVLAADPLVPSSDQPPRERYQGWDDRANRSRLLEAASFLDPEWIMFLDADERLDEADGDALRRFVEEDALPGFAYGFTVFRMVDGTTMCDASSPLVVYRLFAFERDQKLPERRLHFVPIPTAVPRDRWLPTNLRIQHLGGSTVERRAARFAEYQEADPALEFQADYSNLLREPTTIIPWEPRPPGLRALAIPEGNGGSANESEGPVLSAVVIAHHDEKTIARSVRAVVEQKLPVPFEVIVVTSGGDRTGDIVKREFPEVKLVEFVETALPGKARNAGLRLATGEYVSFPGSHVELPPGSLAARVAGPRQGIHDGDRHHAQRRRHGGQGKGLLPRAIPPSSPDGRPPSWKGRPHTAHIAVTSWSWSAGSPEDMRAGEDTVVNNELWRRGYKAYRAQDVWLVHHSPCRTPVGLARHHFIRGRAGGRILLEFAAHPNATAGMENS